MLKYIISICILSSFLFSQGEIISEEEKHQITEEKCGKSYQQCALKCEDNMSSYEECSLKCEELHEDCVIEGLQEGSTLK